MNSHSNVIEFPSAAQRARQQPRVPKKQVKPKKATSLSKINANDNMNLQRVVWMICKDFTRSRPWSRAIWSAFRRAARCPAPRRFEVRHIPAVAAEAERIFEITEAVQDHFRRVEKEAMRRIVRNREPLDVFVEEMWEDEKAVAIGRKPLKAELEKWHNFFLSRLKDRELAGSSDHSQYSEENCRNTGDYKPEGEHGRMEQ